MQNLELWLELLRVLQQLERDPQVRGVIWASGLRRDVFTAGNDLKVCLPYLSMWCACVHAHSGLRTVHHGETRDLLWDMPSFNGWSVMSVTEKHRPHIASRRATSEPVKVTEGRRREGEK